MQSVCFILLLNFFQKFLESCKNRIVLFDNKTKDETKRAKQMQGLLYLVDSVIASNGGKPFSDKLFDELKVRSQLCTFAFMTLNCIV